MRRTTRIETLETFDAQPVSKTYVSSTPTSHRQPRAPDGMPRPGAVGSDASAVFIFDSVYSPQIARLLVDDASIAYHGTMPVRRTLPIRISSVFPRRKRILRAP
jgi:hypothetical protein